MKGETPAGYEPGEGTAHLLLATADKAAEDLEEEIDDANADEGKADRDDIRKDHSRVIGGSGFQRRDRRVDLGEAGRSRTFREGGERSEERTGREHLLFHVCFSFLRLVVCSKHADNPPRRAEDSMQNIPPQNAKTKGEHEGMKGGGRKELEIHGRENVKKRKTGLPRNVRIELIIKKPLRDFKRRFVIEERLIIP